MRREQENEKKIILLLLILISLLCGFGTKDTRSKWNEEGITVSVSSAYIPISRYTSSYDYRYRDDVEPKSYNFIYFYIFLIYGIIWGVVCKKVIYNRGYRENWFWWGFFFGVFAFLVAISKPQKQIEKIQEMLVKPSDEKKTTLEILAEETENKRKLQNGGWKCSNCGRVNYDAQVNCECGQRKPNKYADIDKKAEIYKLKETGWICKKCGSMNSQYSYICKCGLKKSENENYDLEDKEIESQKNSTENLEIIKKYKELLDMGAITQEEFDLKKKKLI